MRFQTELNVLPKRFQKVIIPLLTSKTTEDQFHDMVLACYESYSRNKRNFVERTKKEIEEMQKEQRRETNAIYNPYRNISFNQCYGDSNIPASEWLKLPYQEVWDDPFSYDENI